MIGDIFSLVEAHEEWRGKKCLNLIPSENVMSPSVRRLLSSDFAHRYTSRDKFYRGTRFTDEIEALGEKIACDVFDAETADLRPLSGHIADLVFIAGFAKPGDTLMCVSAENGGYPGIWKQGLPSFLQLKLVEFPFSRQEMNIKVEEAQEVICEVKPNLIIFGASLFLFPHPVRELVETAEQVDAKIGFDGSHVLGLIGGGEFQNPLQEGADALFGSTHKTFFGPQGGIILARKEYGEVLRRKVFPAFVDNAHWNRIVALTLALVEMKEFGRAYARQVIRNAQTLAKALADYGFPVACQHLGFTRSHQVWLNYGDYKKGGNIASRLEKANIIADSGVRLGTCEVTRRGMREQEMMKIAEYIKRIVMDNEDVEKVKHDVERLLQDFQRVHYCFDTK
jgi:glycine hydroxymethyltransferase